MNLNWNKLQDGNAVLTTYTLLNEDTNSYSIFVYDNELETPVYINHMKESNLLDKFYYDNDHNSLAENLEYFSFVELAIWMGEYIDHYSEVHPSIQLRNLNTSFSTLNTFHIDIGAIYTVNINLNTFSILAKRW